MIDVPKHTRHIFASGQQEASDILILAPVDRCRDEKVLDCRIGQRLGDDADRCAFVYADSRCADVYVRLSTCCNATTESAGKLCCASSASRKVSGATERCCGGGMEGC